MGRQTFAIFTVFSLKTGVTEVLHEKFLTFCIDFLHYCGPGSGKILKRSSLHKLCHREMWLYGIKLSVSIHCLCTGIVIKQGLIFKCVYPVMCDNVTKSFNMNTLGINTLSVMSSDKLMLIT